ncbi:MAG: FG-GAP repeat protein [Candidatus Woesebacteria bacterium GW2011_GWC1_42_9]|nr:MAG: FG-GAP repeat protein [Candidatus Woesebacteria bacterium GW2011_GWC1_42_9]
MTVNGQAIGNALVTLNETGSNDILTASASGTSVFTIANNGNVNIGTASTNPADLTIKGDVILDSQTEITTSIGTIYDMFAYDTSKDSDGGTWTNSITAQSSSWYTEALDASAGVECDVSGSDDRCEQAAFPEKAVIIGSSTELIIIDEVTNNLWMRFGVGTTAEAIEGVITEIYAQDGQVFVSTNGGSGDTGLFVIDFKLDRLIRYDAVNRSTSDQNIAGRNGTNSYATNTDTDFALGDDAVNDFDVTKVNGVTYYALATDGSAYILDPNKAKEDVLRKYYTSAATDDINNVRLTTGGELIATNETATQLQVFSDIQSDTADVTAADQNFTTATTPEILANPGSTKYALEVYEDRAMKIYYGSSAGVDVFQIDADGSTVERGGIFHSTLSGTYNNFYDLDNAAAATDISGNSADSTSVSGTPTLIVGPEGTADSALDFDNASNEYFIVADADVPILGASFTMGGWLKVDSADVQATQGIMGTYNATGDGWIFYYSEATGILAFYDDGANMTSTQTLPVDEWVHVAFTFADNVSEGSFYVNGQLVDTGLAGARPTDGINLYLGTQGVTGATTADFDGGMDDLFIIDDKALSQSEIQAIMNRGKGWLHTGVADATDYSASTIGDSSMAWKTNEFVGEMVEITGGTGSGQYRTVKSNTATVLTITPNWATTPDTTSDFRILKNVYPGVIEPKAIFMEGQNAYFGDNDGSDGGGAFAFTRQNDYQFIGKQYYNGAASLTDDTSTAWGATYDDITAIQTLGTNKLFITSDTHYWKEYTGESLLRKTASLTNQVDSLNQSTVKALDSSGNVLKNQVIRTGTTDLPAASAVPASQTITTYYGITFDSTPMVVTSPISFHYVVSGVDTSAWDMRAYVSSAQPGFFNVNRYISIPPYTTYLGAVTMQWLAIGPYTEPIGADLAEYYQTYDLTAEAGDVVSIDTVNDISVTKSLGKEDRNAIGIIATKPGLVLGNEDGSTAGVATNADGSAVKSGQAKTVQVALAGRVPVKVTLENGPIKKGDYLVPASKPGYAMKGVNPGISVGRAMEDFDGSSTIVDVVTPDVKFTEEELKAYLSQVAAEASASGQLITHDNNKDGVTDAAVYNEGKVMAFVQTGYWDGGIGSDWTRASQLLMSGSKSISTLQSGSLLTEPITLDALGGYFDSQVIAQDEVSAPSEEIEALEEELGGVMTRMAQRIIELESRVNNLENQQGEQIDTQISTNLESEITDLTVSGSAVLGDVSISGELSVGTLIIDGLNNKIDAVGSLELQPGRLGSIEIMNGLVSIDEKGNVTAQEITAQKYNVSGESAGSGIITKGKTEIYIPSELVTANSIIMVTPTSPTLSPLVVTEKESGYGFQVETLTPVSEDISFGWFIVDKVNY